MNTPLLERVHYMHFHREIQESEKGKFLESPMLSREIIISITLQPRNIIRYLDA